MAGLLAALAVMAILMTAAMPTWRQAAQREREEELIFRGKQFARAIELYQRKYANAFPPNFDVLIEQHFLRKKYKDPMVEDGEFQLLYQVDMQQGTGRQSAGGRTGTGGQARGAQPSNPMGSSFSTSGAGGQTGTSGPRGGVIGVVSKSPQQSIRLYNGRNYYNEWQFVYVPTTIGTGGLSGGAQRPGQMQGPQTDQGGFGGMGGGRGRGGQRGMGPGGPQRGPGSGEGPGGGGPMGPPRGAGRGPG